MNAELDWKRESMAFWHSAPVEWTEVNNWFKISIQWFVERYFKMMFKCSKWCFRCIEVNRNWDLKKWDVQSNIPFQQSSCGFSSHLVNTKGRRRNWEVRPRRKGCGYAVTASNGLGRTIIFASFLGRIVVRLEEISGCQLLASFWSFAKDREHENCCNCRSWMQMDISHILKWINELRLDLRRGTTLRCTELRHQLTIGCRASASTATLLTQWSATSLSGSVPLVTALSIVLASNAHSRARERIWGVALDALPFDAILWDGRVQLIIIPERHASVTIASGSSERASFPVLETLAFVELAGGLIETPDPNPENTQIKDEPTDRQRSAQARCFALFKWGEMTFGWMHWCKIPNTGKGHGKNYPEMASLKTPSVLAQISWSRKC